jgi:hypothetical protein
MMAAWPAVSLVAVAAWAISADASRLDPARAFLIDAFDLTASDMDRIDKSQVVTRALAVENRREVATLGIARIRTTPAAYVELLNDIAVFKRTDDVLQIAKFSAPPQMADLASLTIEEADLDLLRDCRVEDCGVRLPAELIERVRREIDWRTPDSSLRAGGLVRRLLVDYVDRYQVRGAAAAMEYADTASRLNVGREFASLIAADTMIGKYVPHLRRHLLEYPAGGDGITDFIYWSKERVHRRSVVSITHVSIAPSAEGPVSYAIGSKQIYAMHYFDASLGLTLLVRDTTEPSPATYVVYLNRSRIDLFDGVFGGVVRSLVAGRARSLVAEQLGRLQRTLPERTTAASLVTPEVEGGKPGAGAFP